MKNDRNTLFQNAKRAVIKIGSGVLTHDDGLNLKVIKSISEQISGLIDKGCEVILVSSGAVASGMKKINLKKKPETTPEKQAAAAIGQAGLILEYEKAFSSHKKKVAQILLTQSDLTSRKRYLNARNTINTLLTWNVIPIINENDTVVTDEIKFGDNDHLSAMIALLLNADVLVNLTDIDGLYNKDPRTNPDAELLPVIATINKKIEMLASSIPGAVGTGGMLSKIKAAKKTTSAGVPMVIAPGNSDSIIQDLFSGKEEGTYFTPKRHKLGSRKSWIAFNSNSLGTITLDDGAKSAIINDGKSLLPSGILKISGEFQIGATVKCVDRNNKLIGAGLVNYSSANIDKIKGLKSNQIEGRIGFKEDDEVIHRDNLAVTE
jgi:glutamate 5-kinase